MVTKLPIEDRIIKARVQLMAKYPFFGHLAMYLKIQKFPQEEIDAAKKSGGHLTAAVDGGANLWYNPEWMDKLDDAELMFVVAHEVMHPANMHMQRCGNRNHEAWNVATDVVINRLLEMNGLKMPADVHKFNMDVRKFVDVKDPEKYAAEELYDKYWGKVPKIEFDVHIYDPKGKPSDGGGKGKDKVSGDIQAQYDENLWKNRTVEAMERAKQRGNMPAGMKRYIDDLIEPKLNWKELLQKYITKEIPYDFTWRRPSKRSIATGIYLPSVMREGMELVTSIDTSGSMGNNELAEAMTEIYSITKAFPFVKMTVIVADAAIHNVVDVTPYNGEQLKELVLKGGGGTSHKPVYKWLKDNKPATRLLINLTDGYTDFPANDNGFNTIWVLTSNGADEKCMPFGQVVKIHKNGNSTN